EIVTYHWEVSYDWGRSIHIKGDANSKRLCIIISSSDRGFDLTLRRFAMLSISHDQLSKIAVAGAFVALTALTMPARSGNGVTPASCPFSLLTHRSARVSLLAN